MSVVCLCVSVVCLCVSVVCLCVSVVCLWGGEGLHVPVFNRKEYPEQHQYCILQYSWAYFPNASSSDVDTGRLMDFPDRATAWDVFE